MDKIHLLTPKERLPYFEAAASEMGVSVSMIEKDYWVVWVLGQLFNLVELKKHLTFKGGTSLSKVYGLIERFSEDVDLSIEKSFFGFSEENSIEKGTSRKQRNISLEKLSHKCGHYVQKTLLKALIKDFSEQLHSSDWNLILDEADPTGQTLLFEYPVIAADKAGYIRPSVKIELGARSEHWPVSHHKIKSYLKEFLQEKIDEPEVTVKVLNAERTFWEKATILHQYAHLPAQKNLPLRLSRHYYDFYCLLQSYVKKYALATQDLLEKVARHKEIYFPSTWANYLLAKKGSLKLAPPDRILSELEKDYRLMRDMFFKEPVSWDEVMELIEQFETEFNS